MKNIFIFVALLYLKKITSYVTNKTMFVKSDYATSFLTRRRFNHGGPDLPEDRLKGMSRSRVHDHLIGECCKGSSCSTREIDEFRRRVPMSGNILIDIQCELGQLPTHECRCAGVRCGLAYYKQGNRCTNPCKRQKQFHCTSIPPSGYNPLTTCLPIGKQCNSIKDCPGGEDEKDCSILTKLSEAMIFNTSNFLNIALVLQDRRYPNIFYRNKYAGIASITDRPLCRKGVSEKSATVFCNGVREPKMSPKTRGVPFKMGSFGWNRRHPFQSFLMANVRCKGDERNIGMCSHDTYSDACAGGTFGDMMGIACFDPSQLKLVGGETKYEGRVSYIGASLRLSVALESDQAKTIGRSVCTSIFGEEFGRGAEGVPLFGYMGVAENTPGACIDAVCDDANNLDINKCELDFTMECLGVDAAKLACAKCTQAKLISLVESVKNTRKSSGIVESLKVALAKLDNDCRHWTDCSSERKYEEYCLVREFVENGLFTVQPMTKGDAVLIPNEYLDHSKMLELNALKLQFNEQKEMIVNLGEQLSVGISEYFSNLAKFDDKVAEADLAYARDKWEQSKSKAENMRFDIDNLLNEIISAAITTVKEAKKDSEQKAIFSFFNALNPKNYADFDFSGLLDVSERFNAMSTADRDVKVLEFLPKLLQQMSEHVKKLAEDIKRNAEMFKQINYLVSNSALGTSIVNFETASAFLKAYNDFSPAVSKNGMATYVALVEEMIDKSCAVIEEAETTTDEAGEQIEKQSCTKVKGKLASMAAFFEDLEEQQFDVMDSFARLARSKIAEKSAQSIAKFTRGSEFQVKKAILKKNLNLVLRTQKAMYIEAECNRLTYMRHGEEISECSTLLENPEQSVEGLVAQRQVDMCSLGNAYVKRSVQRIPISRERTQDGFLNLTALYDRQNGFEYGQTTFKIPDRHWLIKNKWIMPSDQGPFFVRKLNIYLPPGSVKEYRYQLQVRFTDNRIANRTYSVGDGQIVKNSYTENAKNCGSSRSVSSHYSVEACEGKLRDVCINSEGDVNNKLLPVLIGSTWYISMSSVAQLKPLQLTDDYIYAYVEFCSIAKKRSRRNSNESSQSQSTENLTTAEKQSSKRIYSQSTRKCCNEGLVYNLTEERCVECPSGHQPYLWDRYCEQCPPGYQSQQHPFGCHPCTWGTFKRKSGPGQCQPCKAGSDTNKLAATRCLRVSKASQNKP